MFVLLAVGLSTFFDANRIAFLRNFVKLQFFHRFSSLFGKRYECSSCRSVELHQSFEPDLPALVLLQAFAEPRLCKMAHASCIAAACGSGLKPPQSLALDCRRDACTGVRWASRRHRDWTSEAVYGVLERENLDACCHASCDKI